MKAWEKLVVTIQEVERALSDIKDAARNIDGVYTLDDLMSSISDVEAKLD